MLSGFDSLLIAITFTAILLGFTRRYRMWNQGKPGEIAGRKKRGGIVRVVVAYLFHRTILKDLYGGIAHLFIFWEIVVAIIVVIASQFNPSMPLWSARAISMFLDIAGVLAVVGAVMLLMRKIRRYKFRQVTRLAPIVLFLAVLISGFLAEGGRLNISGQGSELGAFWSPVGAAAAILVPDSPASLDLLIRLHFFLVLFFLACLPFSALRHTVAATLTTYYAEESPNGRIEPLRLEGEHFGVGNVKEFKFSQLLKSDACMDCGRCEESCPAHLSGQPLSPMGVIDRIREKMEEGSTRKTWGTYEAGTLLSRDGKIGSEDLWCCTTCLACVENCPALVGQLDNIIDIRRYAVLTESKSFPSEYKQVFRNIEVFGDILGKGSLTREDWTSSLHVKRIYEDSAVEMLFWVGCIGALYDEVSRKTVIDAARILQKAGVSFGILGKEELCCGDSARRMGDEYIFQLVAKKNIETLRKYGVKKIVTACPHCFNVLRNEYVQFGGHFEVVHFSELIHSLLETGALGIKSQLHGSFTYHDPCYLGRYNGIYQAPREILSRLLSTGHKELENSKERALCCGAGGGNFWRKSNVGRRIEDLRIKEITRENVSGVVTACPLCKIMLNSAAKQMQSDYSLKVLDTIDIVAETTL